MGPSFLIEIVSLGSCINESRPLTQSDDCAVGLHVSYHSHIMFVHEPLIIMAPTDIKDKSSKLDAGEVTDSWRWELQVYVHKRINVVFARFTDFCSHLPYLADEGCSNKFEVGVKCVKVAHGVAHVRVWSVYLTG